MDSLDKTETMEPGRNKGITSSADAWDDNVPRSARKREKKPFDIVIEN